MISREPKNKNMNANPGARLIKYIANRKPRIRRVDQSCAFTQNTIAGPPIPTNPCRNPDTGKAIQAQNGASFSRGCG